MLSRFQDSQDCGKLLQTLKTLYRHIRNDTDKISKDINC